MANGDPRDEKKIFYDAVEIRDDTQRSSFVATACAGNPALLKSITSLLKYHDRQTSPLDQSATLVTELATRVMKERLPREALGLGPGVMVGPYRLIEQIGEGGFGLVFAAEQEQPVRREVALKVIKPGMESRAIMARFEAERQTLAMMDHPHVSRVYDAGISDTGRSYFAMELVRGVPITRFCADQPLPLRNRLELFVTVCEAVQHAHQKGIIHRDLKPSNVLVSIYGTRAVPHVIDFGVAKALDHDLVEQTLLTRHTAMIGTPAYMSPEQADMGGIDIDTRSDIYSLGVLLYEMLTGMAPFDKERLSRVGLDELRRIIRDEEPPRASSRLTASDPAGLMPLGDLDWILAKAMEKDRNRRYDSASALADDVQRFLNEAPVTARPPSPLYRLRKFARRNRIPLLAGSCVALALLVGTTISTWQAIRATIERNEKERALREAVVARQEAEEAQEKVERFADRLTTATRLTHQGRALAAQGAWQDARDRFDQAIASQPDYYLAWSERAAFHGMLGLGPLAASDYIEAIERGASLDELSTGAAAVLWYGGERTRYDRLTADTVHALLTQDDAQAVSLSQVRACLLGDRSPEAWRRLADLAQQRMESPLPPRDADLHPQRAREGVWTAPPLPPDRDHAPLEPRGHVRPHRQPPPLRELNDYLAGWASLNAGDVEEAIRYLERIGGVDSRWPGNGIQMPLLARAYHASGQTERANDALEASTQLINQWLQGMERGPWGEAPIPWFDWIEFVDHYRRACQAMSISTESVDRRLREREAQSLQAIGDPVAASDSVLP